MGNRLLHWREMTEMPCVNNLVDSDWHCLHFPGLAPISGSNLSGHQNISSQTHEHHRGPSVQQIPDDSSAHERARGRGDGASAVVLCDVLQLHVQQQHPLLNPRRPSTGHPVPFTRRRTCSAFTDRAGDGPGEYV